MNQSHEFFDVNIHFTVEQDLYDYKLVGKVKVEFADGYEIKFGRSSSSFNFVYSPDQESMEREVTLAIEYVMYGIIRKLKNELDKVAGGVAVKMKEAE